jgi:hypothetical protein
MHAGTPRLKEGAAPGGPPLLGAAIAGDAGSRPPTPAMQRFADRIVREKGVKPPPGYATTVSICRAFLNQHAPRKADAGIPGPSGSKPASGADIICRRRKASLFPTRPRPVRLPCRCGSTPIRSRRVARAVASVSTRRRDQSLLNPRFKERDLGKARQMSLPQLLRQRRLGGIREPIPHCGFPTATRMPP